MDKLLSDWCEMNSVSYEKCKGRWGNTYYVFEKHLDMESDEGVSFAIDSLFSGREIRSKVKIPGRLFCEDPEISVNTIDYLAKVLLGQ